MTKADEPAFPNIGDRVEDTKDGFVFTPVHKGGLTKREYFAAMAMQGIISNRELYRGFAKLDTSREIGQIVASASIEYANALIEELEKK